MVLLEVEKACKEHPYHNQNKGVCPACLRERLSQLHQVVSSDKEAVAAADGPSSSSSSMSFSSSNNMSSVYHHRYQRNMSDIMGSISFRVSAGNGLKNSRSIAFVSRSSRLVGEVKHGTLTNKNKKKGFWSKLLHLKGKNNEEINFGGKMVFNV
ncbi:hypothetical protein P3X46_018508 [Hevea brasiliensis]|uniref:Uncharacterized protein n=1 Tax=Hevea brasiliensis TaxID=3981 RepID=A0ABQ9LSX2_HEVBR|nr:uncharacterized protein LOC110670571 [Hevea brasiliensis]KAJ9170398.1 hypothetical protein P3X46_018508 [Hevea brasiliensis]